MKITFIHYNWKINGVTRVVLNNIDGLMKLYPNISVDLIGGVFEVNPERVGKVQFGIEDICDGEEISKRLHYLTSECDAVVIENPLIGNRLEGTKGFKQFSEETDKKVLWRHHDFVNDRPQYHKKFLNEFGTFRNAYAKSDNIQHVVLTSFNQKRLKENGIESKILSNSVIVDDFGYDREKSDGLREILEIDGIVKPGEHILAYPSRIIRRKNIEEALLVTKILNEEGNRYKLLVTLAHNKTDYQNQLRQLAKDFGIPFSFGEVQNYIGNDRTGFSISDLYGISNSAITTSVDEGFGYGFIEPLLSGTQLIGRDLPRVTEDFSSNGVRFNGLYNNIDFRVELNGIRRMNQIRGIMENIENLNEVKDKLDLYSRLKRSEESIDYNDSVVRAKYSHIPIAKQLYDMLF